MKKLDKTKYTFWNSFFSPNYYPHYDGRGYDQYGYNKKGFDEDGNFVDGTKYDKRGYDINGYDKNGFCYRLIDGKRIIVHKDTMTPYNPEGYNKYGFDKDGYDKEGYNNLGRNREGLDRKGFDKSKKHYLTGTSYDPNGIDIDGYNKRKFRLESINGVNKYIHKETKTEYDEHNFDVYEIHKITGTKYDERNFDCYGINKITGTIYDIDGYDIDKRDEDGYTKESAIERSERYAIIVKNINALISGELSVERYRYLSSIDINKLIEIATKSNLDNRTKGKLKKLLVDYKKLDRKTELRELCEQTSFNDGEEIIWMGEYYEFIRDELIKYLNDNKIYVCDYTIKKYLKLYHQNKLDLGLSVEENNEIAIQKEKKKERDQKLFLLIKKAKEVKEKQ